MGSDPLWLERRSSLALSVTGLIALTPCLLAILPWHFEQLTSPLRLALLANGFAVQLVELGVISFAMRLGCSPIRTLLQIDRWSQLLLAVLAVVAIGTAVTAAVPSLALMGNLAWCLHLLFGLALWELKGKVTLDAATWPWGWLAAGVVAYDAMLAILIPMGPSAPEYWSVMIPGLLNVRGLGFYAITGFFACLPLVASHDRQHQLLGGLLGSFSIALAVWSGTRGALAAIFATFVIIAALRLRAPFPRGMRLLIASLVGGTLLSLIYPAPFFGAQRLVDTVRATADGKPDASSFDRIRIWKATYSKIIERPYFGYGDRQFTHVVLRGTHSYKQPHNSLLQIALNWGLVGATAFFLLLGRSYWAGICAASRDHALLAPLAIATALFVYSLYDAALYYPYPLMIIAFCLAMMFPLKPLPDRDRSGSPGPTG